MDYFPFHIQPVWDVILPIDELTWRTAKDHHSQASGADAAVNADAPKKAVPAMPQFSSQSLRSEFWEQK